MHLRHLTLKDFRSCRDTVIHFRPDLTILVGENNAGKSNVIEALRLVTPPLHERRDRYPDDEDISRSSDGTGFVLEACYGGLTDEQKGLLVAAVPDPLQDEAILGLAFQSGESRNSLRGRASVYCGRFREARPEPGFVSPIRHVYLPPLRDAHRVLSSGNGARIAALLRYVTSSDEELADLLRHVGDRAVDHQVINRLNERVDASLRGLTQGVRAQQAALGFAAPDLYQIARDLRFRLGDAGVHPAELIESGLGYANLLFMASVMVELEAARDADLTLFLVEEPEAHLHPQLKTILLDYLRETAEKSAGLEVAAGQPAGQIQVIVTTHSSELASAVSAKHVVVLRPVVEPAADERPEGRNPTGGDPAPRALNTRAVCVGELRLSQTVVRKVDRYLDVTRSALLFSRRAMLVEGVAEALLLPVFAKNIVFKDDPEAYQRFRGCSLVAIDGVDFEPYLDILFKSPAGQDVRIADRVVIVTDGDQLGRRDALLDIARHHGAEGRLQLYFSANTLEADLFGAGNQDLMRELYLHFHRRAGDKLDDVLLRPAAEQGDAFMDLFNSQKTRKGDFAQAIAEAIEDGRPFVVPPYLRDAIVAAAEEEVG